MFIDSMFSEFPNLHPLVVHFPIVLILLGAALQALLVFKDTPALRWGTLVIMGLAFASALVASKVFHAHAADLPAGARAIYLDHEKYAAYTLWISGFAFVFRGIGNYYRIHRHSYETLVLASAMAAAVFLALTGHRGAQLVYVEGVGPKGNLVVREGQDHGGHAAQMHTSAPGGAQGHAGHPDGHGDPPAPGTSVHEGMTGHEKMPGMQHPISTKPGTDHSDAHPTMPASKTKKGSHEAMAGMDHSRRKASPNKKDGCGSCGNGPWQRPSPSPATGSSQAAWHGPRGHAGHSEPSANRPKPGSKHQNRRVWPSLDPSFRSL